MISIIGRGNVGSHLYKAFSPHTEVRLINPHTFENLPERSDLILICVKDDAIEEVVGRLPKSDSIIAHTSGSVPIDVLSAKGMKYGVFYPLQTFTKDRELDYSEIPVFIEADSNATAEILKNYASLFSTNIAEADSQMRRNLHLASVFSCNFVNALFDISSRLLSDSGMDFKVLVPLIKETVDKLNKMNPVDAQTGPAKRGDYKTMEKHLKMLESHPEYQQIYALMSDLIAGQK